MRCGQNDPGNGLGVPNGLQGKHRHVLKSYTIMTVYDTACFLFLTEAVQCAAAYVCRQYKKS